MLVEETQARPRGLRTYWTSFDHTYYVMTTGWNMDRPWGTTLNMIFSVRYTKYEHYTKYH